jgi:hypothetical protein
MRLRRSYPSPSPVQPRRSSPAPAVHAHPRRAGRVRHLSMGRARLGVLSSRRHDEPHRTRDGHALLQRGGLERFPLPHLHTRGRARHQPCHGRRRGGTHARASNALSAHARGTRTRHTLSLLRWSLTAEMDTRECTPPTRARARRGQLYDTCYNPQVDLQAQDRAHRIGQTKQVRTPG